MNNNQVSEWHIGKWTGLGWLETGLKGVAFIVAYVALGRALDAGIITTLPSPSTIQTMTLVILALGLSVAIFDRLQDKEIIAMIFLVFNIVAHWGILFSLARVENAGIFLTYFALFMLAGDIVKIIFIKTTGFTVRDYSQSVLYGLTGFYIFGYILLLVT
jgi:hypothetical protein